MIGTQLHLREVISQLEEYMADKYVGLPLNKQFIMMAVVDIREWFHIHDPERGRFLVIEPEYPGECPVHPRGSITLRWIGFEFYHQVEF